MHKFPTAATKSSGVLHRPRDPQAGASGSPLRGPRSRVAERRQASAFTVSLQEPIYRASKNKEVSHRHAHLHLKMVPEFSKLPFDVVTQMMKKEAGHYSVITVGHFYSIIHRKLR